MFKAVRLKRGPSVVAECVEDGIVEAERYDSSLERAIKKSIKAHGGRPPQGRMLGHAHFFKEENTETYEVDNETLLLEISGYTVNKRAFGEGDFFVTISLSELKAQNLGSGMVVFEPGT